ncbi:unnamed protein product [Anisakis simplex]|uniref:Uncharacterized protein n=1 Tax=Anisakis simplex TaxID=6269 RepID=A0A158PPL4_ANISI|nr:unnamed protein product [Anisakis simplex]
MTFLACLSTVLCVSTGIGGIILACIDIDRFNFGLYLALLSVVGSTISIAFCIISPGSCESPKFVAHFANRIQHSLSTVTSFIPKVTRPFDRTSLSKSIISKQNGDDASKQQPSGTNVRIAQSVYNINRNSYIQKRRLRRSSTWSNLDEADSSRLQLIGRSKKLTWMDDHSTAENIQRLRDDMTDSSRKSSKTSHSPMLERISQASDINLLAPPITLVQTFSSPDIQSQTIVVSRSDCSVYPSIKQSRSCNFLRIKSHSTSNQTDVERISSASSDAATSSSSRVADYSDAFEFRLIPFSSNRSEVISIDASAELSTSSESYFAYQLLEKLSSPESLSTLV